MQVVVKISSNLRPDPHTFETFIHPPGQAEETATKKKHPGHCNIIECPNKPHSLLSFASLFQTTLLLKTYTCFLFLRMAASRL